MDRYRDVALGVECAWPGFYDAHKAKGGRRMRSTMFAALAVALAAASLALLAGCTKPQAHPAAAPAPEVSVIEVRPGPVTVYNEYVAQTQAPDTIEIRAQVTGLLERQLFADGARVQKGDLLYVIDQRPFEAQAAQAKAGLAHAEANLG